MTPEEKAKWLVGKYKEVCRHYNFTESHGWELDVKETVKCAYACALICVNEIIDSWSKDDGLHFHVIKKYWQKVKEEIINQ